MEISQRIKLERQTLKWTQEELADKIFVSKRTISIGKPEGPCPILKVS